MKCKDNKDVEEHLTIGKEYPFLEAIDDENITTIDDTTRKFVAHVSRFSFGKNNDKQETIQV